MIPFAGVPNFDCLANTRGKSSSFAAAIGICPKQRVHPFKAPKQLTMAPRPIRLYPQGPHKLAAASAKGAFDCTS